MIKPTRIDSSVCGAVLSCPASSALIARTPVATRQRLYSTSTPTRRQNKGPWVDKRQSCSLSSQWILSTFIPEDNIRKNWRKTQHKAAVNRSYSTTSRDAAAPTATPEIHSKDHLLSLVGSVEDGDAEDHFNYHKDPFRRGYASPNDTALQISDRKGDVQYPSKDETFKISKDTREIIKKLYHAIGQRIRYPQRTTLEPIYKLYCEIPEPRMLHLTWQWRNRLLKVMGTPKRKDSASMLRYYALVADVKKAGLTLQRTQWNYALGYATKYAARVTISEMESALRLWKEMERDANIQGNDVTFNILFDVAAKAGNFTLAEMIYREMERRGIEFNRFHHVSLIHFFGLKRDSSGVRAAYREMVEAGEMIDTVVLNCVIAGLLRCGEETAAEETYHRMKNDNELAQDMPQRDYMTGKVITRVLMMFTKVSKDHPQLKKSLQANVTITPDLHTFKLLIEHFAIRVGDLNKVAQYLDEMKLLNIQVDPTIFLALFKGFFAHGGFPGSEWSENRLEKVLEALFKAREDEIKGFRIDRWVVIWALRATKKCCSNEMLVQTFDTLSQKWDIPPERHPGNMTTIFEGILEGKNLKVPWLFLDSSGSPQRNKGRALLPTTM